MNSELSKKLAKNTKNFNYSHLDTQSLPGVISAIAQKYPDNVAIKSQSRSMTYRSLDELSEKIANYLIAKFRSNVKPIAVLSQDSFIFNVAILGVLKAGKFYVPLDVNYPEDRINFILESSGAQILLTDFIGNEIEPLSSRVPIRQINEILTYDEKLQPKPNILSDSPAYLIYTSGSTGKPKGVVQSHRNVLHNAMMQTNIYGITTKDRFSQLFSTAVMGAVRATYNAFLNGATLCPFDARTEGFSMLHDWLIDTKLTIFHMPSSLFRKFVGSMRDAKIYQGIRLVILGGESSNNVDFELYKKYFPKDCLFCTGLGSTETCTVRMLLLDKNSDPEFRHGNLALGYEVHGAHISLLDDQGNEVKQGETGEICVSSKYLALGYWNGLTKTWENFEDDLCIPGNKRYLMGDLGIYSSDGCLVHMGRKDFQIKIRGNRIELKEVEDAIRTIEGIFDVVVYPRKNTDQSNELCACIVLNKKIILSEAAIKKSLSKKIPSFMIPSFIGFLQEIPLNHTNKVDYQKLPSVDELISISLNVTSQLYPDENLVNTNENIIIRTLIADSLENASVITFTRNNLRDNFINGVSDIRIDSLNLDSLSIMEFCVDIELKTNISISPEELLHIKTLDELSRRLIEQKI